jgi:3-oxoacyl-[acyl-carrier protein] reductase
MMKVDLEGQVALVTGAGYGIGLSIARAFSANGAVVAFSDVDADAARREAARFPSASAYELDVRKEDQVNSVIDAIVKEHGRLDIVVNNAGVNTSKFRVTADQFPRSEWDWIMDVDLEGVYLVSHAAAKIMVAQGRGRIINISSIAGLVALRLQSAYVAAKHAVIGLTKAMAIELAPKGVLVNAIAPGTTFSESTRKLMFEESGELKDWAKRIIEHIPLGRPAHADEMAHAALFLAAPESSYITGTVLTVDGGWTAGGYARNF